MSEDTVAAAGPAGETEEQVLPRSAEETPEGTEISDMDIVFDCPYCGHNLAIDYRGAGLQVMCVQCGEAVSVPIPEDMHIDDLDVEPGEILKQLFKTRRMLRDAENRGGSRRRQCARIGERSGDGGYVSRARGNSESRGSGRNRAPPHSGPHRASRPGGRGGFRRRGIKRIRGFTV